MSAALEVLRMDNEHNRQEALPEGPQESFHGVHSVTFYDKIGTAKGS